MMLHDLRTKLPAERAPIMTFAEMVELCRSLGLGLYLDIKAVDMRGMPTVFAQLKQHHMIRYAVFGSFRPDWLAEIKAYEPNAVTSVLFSFVYVEPVTLAHSVSADYVHPCFERFDSPQQYIAGEWLQRVRDAGLGVMCWHEERPDVIRTLYELGVDGICSDQPELLTTEANKHSGFESRRTTE